MPTQMQFKKSPSLVIDLEKLYRATIKTPLGDLVFDLWPSAAPFSVNNFVFLATEGFYKDNQFHRIIKGFIAQGGCPIGDGRGGPGYKVRDDEVTRQYLRGTLAMSGLGPNSAGSQFFIVDQHIQDIPPIYSIFGTLYSGDDVLDKLMDTPVIPNVWRELSTPRERSIIYDILVEETILPDLVRPDQIPYNEHIAIEAADESINEERQPENTINDTDDSLGNMAAGFEPEGSKVDDIYGDAEYIHDEYEESRGDDD